MEGSYYVGWNTGANEVAGPAFYADCTLANSPEAGREGIREDEMFGSFFGVHAFATEAEAEAKVREALSQGWERA